MIRNRFGHIILLVYLFCSHGCVSEYVPKDIDEIGDLLVVTGTISSGESIFRLNRSVELSGHLYDEVLINNATVYVETNDGMRMEGRSINNGEYSVSTGELDPDKKYRLFIAVDGEEYQSGYLSPLFTPEIDSISFEKKAKGSPVLISVSTHDPDNQSSYYRWLYEENWEIRSELFAQAGYINGEFTLFSLQTPLNTYYCWGKSGSKKQSLASSDKLSENVISNKRLIEIPCSHDKLSILYHVEVKQIQIRKEAYDYFSNLQKNVEQTGSIFAPVPSEMKGNINCITNPELPVIGFIEVATITSEELFIPENGKFYEPPFFDCLRTITSDPTQGFPIYTYSPPEVSYATHRCVDCRTRENASKNKPDFWPTEHL